MSTNVNNDNTDFEQELQAYIQHMQQEMNLAEQLVQALETQGKVAAQAEAEMSEIVHLFHLTGSKTQIDAFMKSEATNKNAPMGMRLNAQKYLDEEAVDNTATGITDSLKQQLEAIDPNIGGTLQILDQLLAESQHLLNSGVRSEDFNTASTQLNQIIHQLCQVIMDKIQIDLAQAGEKKFGGDPNHSAAILQFAAFAIKGEFNEQQNLQEIQTEVMNDKGGWQSEKSQAEADLKTSHWYDFFTGKGPDKAKDRAQIRCADGMMAILSYVEEAISPMIQTIDPGMEEFKIELNVLKEKFQQFLNGHGTIQDLKDAMIEALSIMVGIIAETSNDASMFDKEMSEGSQTSSLVHMKDSFAQEKVIEDAKKYAAIMGKLLNAVKYLGMAIILLLNPTAAMAFMVLIDAILNATHVMDKMQNAIANKWGVGGTWAAVLTSLFEAAGTAGGAAAIEGVISKFAVEAAIKASEEAVEEVVTSVVQIAAESATKAAGQAGVAGAEEAAEQVTSKAVREAVLVAQKKVADTFLKKTIPELIVSLAKGDMKVAMEVAQKEAAESAAQQVKGLAEIAAKQGSAAVIGKTEITSIATKAANEGTVKAMGITEKSAAKMGESSASGNFGRRSGFMLMASAGSTGLPTYLFADSLHKKKDDLGEGWQITFQIINTLLELIGMLAASGAGAEMLQSPGMLMSKILLLATGLNGVAGAVGSGGEASAQFEQASAVQRIAKDQSGLEMMQFILEQLQKDGNLQRDQYAKEMTQIGRTNLQLSKHFNDAEAAVAEAMAVSAV